MALQDLIIGSYGHESFVFVGHELERQSASDSLTAANDENVGFNEFKQRHIQYMVDNGCPQPHIQDQLIRVNTLDLYFRLD